MIFHLHSKNFIMLLMTPEYENLINSLIKDGYLKTPEIIEGFKATDRVDFVPEEYKGEAYVNAPLPIGFSQTISQPLTVAFMIELLEPKVGEKILEIGAGSGWQTAILAYRISEKNPKSQIPISKRFDALTVPSGVEGQIQNSNDQSSKPDFSGRVVAIERIPELKEMAEKNVAKYDFLNRGIVQIIKADGSKGYRKGAPYDKIIAGAASAGDVPPAWRKQLKIGGRIVSPVGSSIHVIDKISKNEYAQKEYFGFSFVPLIKE